MLRLVILLESPYNQKVKAIIEEVMDLEEVNYCFQDRIDALTTFVFASKQYLEELTSFTKLIYIEKTCDLSLANRCLFEFIDITQIDKLLKPCLNKLLDYYFNAYYFELEHRGFELNDIVYLSFENYKQVKIIINTSEEFVYEVSGMPSILPKMFKSVDENKYVNMMYVTLIDKTHYITPIDKESRLAKFVIELKDTSEPLSNIALGDKFEKQEIQKAQIKTVIFICVTIATCCLLMLKVASWSMFLLVVLVSVFLYKPVFLSVLGSRGIYLSLDEKGIYINENLKMEDRYRYAMSLLNGNEILKSIPLVNVRNVSLSCIKKISAFNARFLQYGNKSYQLVINIDTTLDHIIYQSEDNWLFGTTKLNQEKMFLNGLYILNIPFSRNEIYRYALNDADISFVGYMNFIRWKESIESK